MVVCLSMALASGNSYGLASSNSYKIVTSGIVAGSSEPPEMTRFQKLHIFGFHKTGGFDDATADFIGQNFNLLIIDFESFEARPSAIRRMKNWNPNLVVLLYRGIPSMYTNYPDWAEVDRHEDWFLHDKNGNRLVNKDFGWYAMDVGHPEWRNYYASWAIGKFDEYPGLIDGIFADDAWGEFPYWAWTVPSSDIPPEIGERWHNDLLEMVIIVKSVFGAKLLILNTQDRVDYVDASDGILEELFMHPGWWGIDEWHDDWLGPKGPLTKVEELQSISERGKWYIAHSGTILADPPRNHAVMFYCFGAYLLGANGPKATFGWMNWDCGELDYMSDWGVNIGNPIGKYYLKDKLYMRDYEHAKIVVNLDAANTYSTVIDGVTYTLGPHSAQIVPWKAPP